MGERIEGSEYADRWRDDDPLLASGERHAENVMDKSAGRLRRGTAGS